MVTFFFITNGEKKARVFVRGNFFSLVLHFQASLEPTWVEQNSLILGHNVFKFFLCNLKWDKKLERLALASNFSLV